MKLINLKIFKVIFTFLNKISNSQTKKSSLSLPFKVKANILLNNCYKNHFLL